MIAGLALVGVGAFVCFLLDAGMNGAAAARGWPLGVAAVCFLALGAMGVK